MLTIPSALPTKFEVCSKKWFAPDRVQGEIEKFSIEAIPSGVKILLLNALDAGSGPA